jgi:hypothetical protein
MHGDNANYGEAARCQKAMVAKTRNLIGMPGWMMENMVTVTKREGNLMQHLLR